MPDALQLAPTVIDGCVSIVRLHGEACFDCGAVSKTLRAAGQVMVRGNTRVWRIVTCGCRTSEAVTWTPGSRGTPATVQPVRGHGQR
jgi:hypothetical protein